MRRFWNALSIWWHCRKGHIAPAYVRLLLEYKTEKPYAELWECQHCGERWLKKICAVEAGKRQS